MSFMSGPTSVPWRVRTASTAIARCSILRITFSAVAERLFCGAGSPVRFGPDEERGLARVPVGHLHDQVGAEPGTGGERQQLGIARGPAEDVGPARHARGILILPGA